MPKKNAPETTEELMSRLQKLDSQRSAVLAQIRAAHGGPAMPHIPLWKLIQDHLALRGGAMPYLELVDDLIAAGHDLGKYPKRTVKNSLSSPSLASTFQVQEVWDGQKRVEMVSARLSFGDMSYAGQPARRMKARQQTSGSASLVN